MQNVPVAYQSSYIYPLSMKCSSDEISNLDIIFEKFAMTYL